MEKRRSMIAMASLEDSANNLLNVNAAMINSSQQHIRHGSIASRQSGYNNNGNMNGEQSGATTGGGVLVFNV